MMIVSSLSIMKTFCLAGRIIVGFREYEAPWAPKSVETTDCAENLVCGNIIVVLKQSLYRIILKAPLVLSTVTLLATIKIQPSIFAE